MEYLSWDQIETKDLSDSNISDLYNKGYVFTRINKGVMYKTRSLRINLSKFSLHTKNKRVLRITDGLQLQSLKLPMNQEEYSWQIHSLGKKYYATKFGEGIFSASKIKELITNNEKSHFTNLLKFVDEKDNSNTVGYCIIYQNSKMLHYAYPFYDLEKYFNHYGMGMMLRAILFAIESKNEYFYIGSVSRPADIYKLYFRGLEWFDGNEWQTDIEEVKKLISSE